MSETAYKITLFNETALTITDQHEIYTCNRVWASNLVLASTVLLVFGIVGVVVNYRALGPDVLGYVSTTTRDNPYIPLAPGGGALSGMERARLLKDLRVKIDDAWSTDKEEYHIALSSVQLTDMGKPAMKMQSTGFTPLESSTA